MSQSVKVLVQSVDGPYVLVELTPEAVAFLARVREVLRVDRDGLGLEGLVLKAPEGISVRYASGLTTPSIAGYLKLFGDPLNEAGPHFLIGYRLVRVHVFVDSFWLFAVDDTDPTHLPESNRSDSIAFDELGARGQPET